MSVNFNVELLKLQPNNEAAQVVAARNKNKTAGFAETIEKGIGGINDKVTEANTSIADLLSGKQQDINSVVASVAKAEMSFKLLLGVRNKLVEAYKETMKMQG